jgi:hypothetical protein
VAARSQGFKSSQAARACCRKQFHLAPFENVTRLVADLASTGEEIRQTRRNHRRRGRDDRSRRADRKASLPAETFGGDMTRVNGVAFAEHHFDCVGVTRTLLMFSGATLRTWSRAILSDHPAAHRLSVGDANAHLFQPLSVRNRSE